MIEDEPKRAPKKYEPRPWRTAPCSACGEPVKITKPSKSGRHYCTSKPDCQRMKAKEYRAAIAERAATIDKNNVVLLVRALSVRPRQRCSACGLHDALPGYKHPNPDGVACDALGSTKMGAYAGELVDAIWPKDARDYSTPRVTP